MWCSSRPARKVSVSLLELVLVYPGHWPRHSQLRAVVHMIDRQEDETVPRPVRRLPAMLLQSLVQRTLKKNRLHRRFASGTDTSWGRVQLERGTAEIEEDGKRNRQDRETGERQTDVRETGLGVTIMPVRKTTSPVSTCICHNAKH